MNADEFALHCRREKDALVNDYFKRGSQTSVGVKINNLQLGESQLKLLREIIDGALTDAFYSLLMGLDGCGSIGGDQQTYEIYDESGALISECGDLEAAAYEHFHAG